MLSLYSIISFFFVFEEVHRNSSDNNNNKKDFRNCNLRKLTTVVLAVSFCLENKTTKKKKNISIFVNAKWRVSREPGDAYCIVLLVCAPSAGALAGPAGAARDFEWDLTFFWRV